MNASDTIYAFLTSEVKSAFWRDSAWGYIRTVLATNNSFVGKVHSQKVFHNKGQPYVRLYRATVDVIYPDLDCIKPMVIEYTFNPTRKMAHRVERKPVKEKAA